MLNYCTWLIKRFLEQLFPRYCVGCKKSGVELCADCLKTLAPHPELCILCHGPSSDYLVCSRCSDRQAAYRGIMIAFSYCGLIKKLILALKYYHKHDISHFLATKLYLLILCNSRLTKVLQKPGKILITYVPSHRSRRLFIKGYNQSQLLAEHTAELLGAECVQLVDKITYTKSQTTLERAKRLVNLKHAFALHSDRDLSEYSTIIIIDDITTTGSTIQALASCIKSTYPHLQIRGAVIARANG